LNTASCGSIAETALRTAAATGMSPFVLMTSAIWVLMNCVDEKYMVGRASLARLVFRTSPTTPTTR
jgi:hypothetical protein